MGFKLWCCAFLTSAYVVSFLIDFGFFSIVYNHLPGKCTRFNMSGAEDMALFPNKHVLISSGLHSELYASHEVDSGIFLLDLNQLSPEPVRLTLEGFSGAFHPHGVGHWVEPDGGMFLYVVNHIAAGDTVESFEYKPAAKKLVHRKTFRDSSLFYNLNDLVLMGLDRFYVTVDHYYAHPWLAKIETYLRVAWAYVVYFNGERAMVASEGVKQANGIAKSNDGRFVFVNELLRGQIVAYTRNADHTLTRVQALQVEIANDNLFVDPNTGHIWVAILAHPLKFEAYLHDHSVSLPSKCLHISLDQEAELPFGNYSVEEVLSTTGEDGVVGAVTVCLYTEGRLLVGTVFKDMMMCDAPYLMYT